MRGYEIMTIHRPDLTEDDVEAKITELESYLSDSGVTVTKRDLWGKRRFAYDIAHMSEGFYSVLSVQAEPGAVDSIDRMLTLTDEVVRHKIVRPGE